MSGKIENFDFFLLRVPKLPLQTIFSINRIDNQTEFEEALLELFQDESFQEAICLASPQFYSHIVRELKQSCVSQRALKTLYKYIVRMAARPTPFGGFSGVALGKFHDGQSQMVLSGQDEIHVRLDMLVLLELARSLALDEKLESSLVYSKNSCLYSLKDHHRYYEYRINNGRRKYFLTSIRNSTALQLVLEEVEDGKSFGELLRALVAHGAPPDKALNYIKGLIESQVLVSELEPSLTGDDFFEIFLSKLISKAVVSISCLSRLNEVQSLLKQKGSLIQTTTKVSEALKYFETRQSTHKDLLQADMLAGLKDGSLDSSIVSTISSELSELLIYNKPKLPNDLEKFKMEFVERYGDREVELMHAIDPDIGVGYGNNGEQYTELEPLLSELKHEGVNKDKGQMELADLVLDRLISEKLKEDGLRTVIIDADELKAICPPHHGNSLPHSFYAIGNLMGKDRYSLDHGDFHFSLTGCGGVSAIPLMARFAHLDNNLDRALREVARFEQAATPGALLAEIAFFPDAKVGNILQRPSFYDYEIPVLVNSSLSKEKQIPLSDLVVSVKNDRVVLRSKRLGKLVLPRLSNAHNHSRGISVYRFLCDLQYQGFNHGWRWAWGKLDRQRVLPRVQYKHLILTRARWRIPKEDYGIYKLLDLKEVRFKLSEEYAMPNMVVLAEGDNELLLDLENRYSLELLLHALSKSDVILFESLHLEQSNIINDTKGRGFCNEIIFPLKGNDVLSHGFNKPFSDERTIQRSFLPGDSWTYFKVYCSPKQAESILLGPISELVKQLEGLQVLDKWFFIRYADPNQHLRIRIKHKDDVVSKAYLLITAFVKEQFSQYVNTGLVTNIQFDTYQREIERYGVEYMQQCESAFHIDSQFALRYIERDSFIITPDRKWVLAAIGLDQYLQGCGMDLESRLSFAERMRAAFFEEFGVKNETLRALNDNYRRVKGLMEATFAGSDSDCPYLALIIGQRSAKISAVMADIKAKHPFSEQFYSSTLPGICHMSINRHFYFDQRESELVVYFNLSKYYKSQFAKIRNAMDEPKGKIVIES